MTDTVTAIEVLADDRNRQYTDKPLRMRTSDRQLFKRCRRKWNWQSGVRQNLDIADRPSYFWLGTAGHYALEDFHGYNVYGDPVVAAKAHVYAYEKSIKDTKRSMPADYEEQAELLYGILTHYRDNWLRVRDPLKTYWENSQPQVEIHITVPLGIEAEFVVPETGEIVLRPVHYTATIDRMVIIDNELWIADWKFYKQFQQGDLELDQQLTAYMWAASTVYDMPIAGAILHEFKKEIPKEPRILTSGELSTAKNQNTTHNQYRQAAIEIYGSINEAPSGVVDCLNALANNEGEDSDKWIRRRFTRRNEEQIAAEGTRILMEAEEMFNPNLPIYPNFTRDCSWDCQLRDVCLSVDRDDDWQGLLTDLTIDREEELEHWRDHLPTKEEALKL